MEVKKVIKMGVTMEYLGGRILDISMIESFETNPDFSRQYYDKIANFQKRGHKNVVCHGAIYRLEGRT